MTVAWPGKAAGVFKKADNEGIGFALIGFGLFSIGDRCVGSLAADAELMIKIPKCSQRAPTNRGYFEGAWLPIEDYLKQTG
jgi:hypothetical protein